MFDSILEFIKSNQFLSGGALLGITGILIAYLRSWPAAIFHFLKRRIVTEVDIPDRDEAFKWLTFWLAQNPYKHRCRWWTVQTRRQRDYDEPATNNKKPRIILSPAPGVHFLWYRRRLMILQRERKDGGEDKNISSVLGYRETFHIRLFSRDKDIVHSLLEEAQIAANPQESERIRILRPDYDDWCEAARRMLRPLESVILDGNLSELLLNDVKQFLESEKWYNDRGIPYRRGYLLYGPPGNGKCLARGTKILMYNGTLKAVEDIVIGDLLMGPDSKSRKVLSTTQGFSDLFKIVPKKGESYTVNSDHILALKMSGNIFGKKFINISVNDYFKQSKWFKIRAKGYRTKIDFSEQKILLDPYYIGLWLGDGTLGDSSITTIDKEVYKYLSTLADKYNLTIKLNEPCTYRLSMGRRGDGKGYKHPIKNLLRHYGILYDKRIPFEYKINSRQVRLGILAGLLDSDGSKNCNTFDFVTKYEGLADDMLFLTRSLGFAAYKKVVYKSCTNCKDKKKRKYFRIGISGSLEQIPLKIPHKRCSPRLQIKDVLVSGIKIKPQGIGEYFGFELDGDGLFVLNDFTVTHNSSIVTALASHLRLDICVLNLSAFGLTDEKLMSLLSSIPMNSIMLIEDVDCVFKDRKKVDGKESITFSGLLNAIDGVMTSEGRILFMTTNHKDLLDPALIRPGRVDLELFISHASKQQATRIFLRFFPEAESLVEGFANKVKQKNISMAQLQGHLLKYRDNVMEALTQPIFEEGKE